MPNTAPLSRYSRALHNAEALDMITQGSSFWLTLPITSSTGDAEVLYTNPISLEQVGNEFHGIDGVTTGSTFVLSTATGGIVGAEFVGGTLVVQEGPNRGVYLISGTPTSTTVTTQSGYSFRSTTSNQKFKLKRAIAPRITLSGEASTYVDLAIEITTGGARGTAVFKWSNDGGANYTTSVPTAATCSLSGSGLSVNFPDVGTYSTVHRWEQVAPLGRIVIMDAIWDVRTAYSGGVGSTIGISLSTTGSTAKGSVLGGASGDGTSTLTANTLTPGTIGLTPSTNGLMWLPPGATIRHDRITSNFTTGSAYVQLLCTLLPRT